MNLLVMREVCDESTERCDILMVQQRWEEIACLNQQGLDTLEMESMVKRKCRLNVKKLEILQARTQKKKRGAQKGRKL